jgi:hypothetical protein
MESDNEKIKKGYFKSSFFYFPGQFDMFVLAGQALLFSYNEKSNQKNHEKPRQSTGHGRPYAPVFRQPRLSDSP